MCLKISVSCKLAAGDPQVSLKAYILKKGDTQICSNNLLAADNPVISARAGTFKRKQQVRQFLKTMPKENVDDVFSCSYMQNKRVEVCFVLHLYF